MASPFTYDLTTNVGKVRLLLSDTNEDAPQFSDDELTTLLTMEGNSVQRATGKAFIILAGSKAKIAVRIGRGATNEDLTQLAKELREQGKLMLEEADNEADDACLEAHITPSITPFAERQNRLLGRLGDPRDFEDYDTVYTTP